MLEVLGVSNLVVQPQDWDERGKGVKTDRIDALALCQRLDRYVRGNRKAFSAVRVPTEEEQSESGPTAMARFEEWFRVDCSQAKKKFEAADFLQDIRRDAAGMVGRQEELDHLLGEVSLRVPIPDPRPVDAVHKRVPVYPRKWRSEVGALAATLSQFELFRGKICTIGQVGVLGADDPDW